MRPPTSIIPGDDARRWRETAADPQTSEIQDTEFVRGCYLHPENDISNFRLRQRGHIHVILLAVVGENQVLQGHFNSDPLLVRQRRPDVMRLGYYRFIWSQNDFDSVLRDVQRSQYQDKSREGRVARDGLEPVVCGEGDRDDAVVPKLKFEDADSRAVDVEQHHLRLRRLQDEVAEFLDLEAGLEGELELRACVWIVSVRRRASRSRHRCLQVQVQE